jgi:hypothetical protein
MATSAALCAVAMFAVALSPTPARAQSLASRLRAKSLHLVHHDTTRADGAQSARTDTAAAERDALGRAVSLAETVVAHSPLAMQAKLARLYGSAIMAQVQHATTPGAEPVPAADAQPDTAFTRIQTVLRALETRATGGDTTAARQLTRFQLEMNAVAQRLAARDAATPPTRALVKEMQRALECAQTARGCQSPAAVAR